MAQYNPYRGSAGSLDQLANTLLAIGQMKRQMKDTEAERLYRMQMDRQAQDRWQKGYDQDLKEFDWRKELAYMEDLDRDAAFNENKRQFDVRMQEDKRQYDNPRDKLTDSDILLGKFDEALTSGDPVLIGMSFNAVMDSSLISPEDKAEASKRYRGVEQAYRTAGTPEYTAKADRMAEQRTGISPATKPMGTAPVSGGAFQNAPVRTGFSEWLGVGNPVGRHNIGPVSGGYASPMGAGPMIGGFGMGFGGGMPMSLPQQNAYQPPPVQPPNPAVAAYLQRLLSGQKGNAWGTIRR